MTSQQVPVVPDYAGACIANVVPALFDRVGGLPPWLPPELADAAQVVLLVLDGLGWDQLHARRHLAPAMVALPGVAATSVAPTTTAAALTSIATGAAPAVHGVLGYRLVVEAGVLNVLRWSVDGVDARRTVPPASFKAAAVFRDRPVPVVTRAEFARSGFTEVAFGGAHFVGWKAQSSIAVEVRSHLRAGVPFVYAYYDGLDAVAHQHGLGEHYEAELVSVDNLVADVLDALPSGAALVVTSDHGQVEVGERVVPVAAAVTELTAGYSGEGRFMWLHTAQIERVRDLALEVHGEHAWVLAYDEVVDAGWFGGVPTATFRRRLGDVALVAHAPVSFSEPGEAVSSLVARHGSLTAAEMMVPVLVAWS